MKKSRFSDEQIIGFLRQAEAGMGIPELCRSRGFSQGRPHSSLGRIPPALFAQQHRQRAGAAAGSEQKQNFD